MDVNRVTSSRFTNQPVAGINYERHHFTANPVYNLPGSSHGPHWITHGWQLNTVMSFRTGLPFTPGEPFNIQLALKLIF